MRRVVLILLAAAMGAGIWFLAQQPRDDVDGDSSSTPREVTAVPEAGALTLHGSPRAKPDTPAPVPVAESAAAPERAAPKLDAGLVVEFETEVEAPFLAPVRLVLTLADGREIARDVESGRPVEIEGLPAGTVRAWASAAGYVADYVSEETLTAGAWTHLTLTMIPGLPVRGRVVRDDDGSPVEGAVVSARAGGEVGGASWSPSPESYGRLMTDGDGRFRFEALPLDQGLTLFAEARGFRRGEGVLLLATGPAEGPAQEIRLVAGGRLAGTVRGAAGDPVARARVEVVDAGGSGWWPLVATAGDDGAYEVLGLAFDRSYEAAAWSEGGTRSPRATELRVSERTPAIHHEFRLLPPGRLVVEVVDVSGGALPATVTLETDEDRDPKRTEQGTGRIVFDAVERERGYDVTVRSPGRARTALEVRTEAGDETVVRVVPESGLRVSGRIVDDVGAPVPDTVLWLEGGPAGERVLTDSAGRFEMPELPAERTRLRVWAPWTGYYRVVRDVTPPAEGLVIVVPRATTVRVRLVLPAGSPVPSPIVVSEDYEGGGSLTEGGSWEGGVFTWQIGSGTTVVGVRVPGFAPFRRNVEALPGTTVDLGVVALTAGFALTGHVLDSAGQPVSGALLETSEIDSVTVLTDERGAFRLVDLPSGAIELAIRAIGFLDGHLSVDVGTARAATVVTLHRGAVLHGVATDPGGAPIVEADVVAVPVGADPEDGEYAETDAAGHFEMRVPTGRYRIQLQGAPVAEVEALEGGRVEVMLRRP